MRIGIIGQPCIDEIIHLDHSGAPIGDPKPALGGVLYSYAGLERLLSELDASDDSIVPLTWLARADVRQLEPLLARFKHLDRSVGLWPTDHLTNRVQLVYSSDGSRVEHCPNILPELGPSELTTSVIEQLDGLFVNMISGFDVAIDTLESALGSAALSRTSLSRPSVAGTAKRPFVHIDIHALILGELSQAAPGSPHYGEGRKPRGVPEWRQWLAIADSVQLNELEIAWLAHPEITTEQQFIQYIESQRHEHRLKYLIVTRGSEGATLYDLARNEAHHVAAPPVSVRDTTGAGDVFGAQFIGLVLRGMPAADAIAEAVRFATWCTTLATIDEILTAPRAPLDDFTVS